MYLPVSFKKSPPINSFSILFYYISNFQTSFQTWFVNSLAGPLTPLPPCPAVSPSPVSFCVADALVPPTHPTASPNGRTRRRPRAAHLRTQVLRDGGHRAGEHQDVGVPDSALRRAHAVTGSWVARNARRGLQGTRRGGSPRAVLGPIHTHASHWCG